MVVSLGNYLVRYDQFIGRPVAAIFRGTRCASGMPD